MNPQSGSIYSWSDLASIIHSHWHFMHVALSEGRVPTNRSELLKVLCSPGSPAVSSALTWGAEEGDRLPWSALLPCSTEPGEGRQELLQPHLEPGMCCIPPLQPAPSRASLSASLFAGFLYSHIAYLLPDWYPVIIFNLGSC